MPLTIEFLPFTMSLVAVTHTLPHSADKHPDAARPVRLAARNLGDHQTLPLHQHSWGQFTYTPQGMLQVMADGHTWFVPPQRAIWIPASIAHEVKILQASRLRLLNIDMAVSPLSKTTSQVLEVSPLLRELIAALEVINEPGQREQLLTKLILNELSLAASLPIYLPMPQDKRLRSLCQSLLSSPESKLRLADYARQVGASERTLSRLFEQELGMSFSHWRQQMRLSRAAALIDQGHSLSQVAEQLGYTSPSAFTAMFKKTFGIAPRQFFKQQA